MNTIIAFITEDYYSYVGTNPSCSKENRVINSIPYEFSKCSYINYKRVFDRFDKLYLVILVVDIEQEELHRVIEQASKNMMKRYNFKYKIAE